MVGAWLGPSVGAGQIQVARPSHVTGYSGYSLRIPEKPLVILPLFTMFSMIHSQLPKPTSAPQVGGVGAAVLITGGW